MLRGVGWGWCRELKKCHFGGNVSPIIFGGGGELVGERFEGWLGVKVTKRFLLNKNAF